MAQVIKSTPGAIGYVDYATAKASGLTLRVGQEQGRQLRRAVDLGGLGGRGRASRSIRTSPSTRSGVPAQAAYPITYQSWDLVYAKQPNANDAAMLKAYLGYLLGAGQKLLPSLNYAPLPSSIDSQATAQLSKITG